MIARPFVPHVVEHPLNPCPECKRHEPMTVHADRVVWQCGHEQALPSLTNKWGTETGRRYKTKGA